MHLRISTKEPYRDNYFWGCSTYPLCHSITGTILKKQSFEHYYIENRDANSLKFIRPKDFITDAERHFAICKNYKYDCNFPIADIEELDIKLGFEDQNDFFFWIATQQSIITHSVHHHLPVGSPYYFTFKNLTDSINIHFNDIVNSLVKGQQLQIEKSILEWTSYFDILAAERDERVRLSQNKIDTEHKNAVKRKAEKASKDIFNAIRRKDIKAIIALRRKGANINVQNELGLNCIEYAKTLNDDKIIQVLTTNLDLYD